jgi:hypothetical protein
MFKHEKLAVAAGALAAMMTFAGPAAADVPESSPP